MSYPTSLHVGQSFRGRKHGIVRLQIRATQQPGSSTSSLSTSRVVSVTDVGVSVGGMGLCVVRGSAIMVVPGAGYAAELSTSCPLSHAHECRAGQFSCFFLPLSAWGFFFGFRGLRVQFAAVSRKEYDQKIIQVAKLRYLMASSASAQAQAGPGKPVLIFGIDTHRKHKERRILSLKLLPVPKREAWMPAELGLTTFAVRALPFLAALVAHDQKGAAQQPYCLPGSACTHFFPAAAQNRRLVHISAGQPHSAGRPTPSTRHTFEK